MITGCLMVATSVKMYRGEVVCSSVEGMEPARVNMSSRLYLQVFVCL